MKNSKPWYLSKTVWLGIIGTAVGVFQQLTGNPWIAANLPIIGTVFSVLITIQRFLTLIGEDKKG